MLCMPGAPTKEHARAVLVDPPGDVSGSFLRMITQRLQTLPLIAYMRMHHASDKVLTYLHV